MPIGAIIGGATSLLGGLFGNKGKKKEMQLQKDMAQQGVRWRVEDAKQAGIHPLAALGFNAPSYTPVGLGEPLQQGISNAGQGIDRAIQSKQTKIERNLAVQAAGLDIERKQLENDLLRTQTMGSKIALTRQAGQPPAMPSVSGNAIPGQGDSDLFTLSPQDVTHSAAGVPYMEPKAVSDLGYAHTSTGGYAPVPSDDVKEKIEDIMPATIGWMLRNMVAPTFQANLTPPYKAPPGQRWHYNPFRQEYELKRQGESVAGELYRRYLGPKRQTINRRAKRGRL